MRNIIFRKFIFSLINSKGNKTLQRISNDLHYSEDYLTKVFKRFSHKSTQSYMNFCRVIYVLHDFCNGENISVARRRYNYKENALNRALSSYNFPPISVIKGDMEMQEEIKREYEKIQLISILAMAESPIKASKLGNLAKYIKEFRESKEFCICSKPGPLGGYFISNNMNDIVLCEAWINSWRNSMGIMRKYSIV
ncbi:MAG: hypothetical protein IJX86_07975 [Lachnospiraceae bacterium]|nr:hypothetical protein [Lachnospiraceae bacterium]